jgi:seryl-tRNA synthetase
MVVKIARKVFLINDQIQELTRERNQVREELEFHRHINDDAQRDSAVSGTNEDRLEASATAADVKRFERRLRDIEKNLAKLEAKRQSLLAKLD